MKKILLLGFIFSLCYINSVNAAEKIHTRSWLDVPKKVKKYDTYELKRSKKFLEPGKYRILAETQDYYQVGDSIYIKRKDDFQKFKVVYKTDEKIIYRDSTIYLNDTMTIDVIKDQVKTQYEEYAKLSPVFMIFSILFVVLTVVFLYIN